MKGYLFETFLGIGVLLASLAFFVYGYSFFNRSEGRTFYTVGAYFNNVGGLSKGSKVRMAGVDIGYVMDLSFDNNNYRAYVRLNIDNTIPLPKNTIVEVASNGLLGDKYVRLTAGDSSAVIKDGGMFKNTKDVETLEEIFGKLIFITTK